MKPFYLGLTMAGAISAGAYNGGVFDFLMEALEEWEKRKKQLRAENVPEDEWDVPCHDVIIPVMTGASAGGITGALGLIALAEDLPPGQQTKTFSYSQAGEVTSHLPRLYQAWVQMPRLVDPAEGPDFLGTDDLQDGPVESLLDTTILQNIVDATLNGIASIAPARPYLAETLHLYLTHSNLRGIPYEIGFKGGEDDQPGYPMMAHADRVHYVISGAGSGDFESAWAQDDPARGLDLATLPALPGGQAVWHAFAEAAVGTGAFPIGLRARKIEGVTVKDYEDRQWPIDVDPRAASSGRRFKLPPRFPEPQGGGVQERADYVTVDGGMINNEPFELARWTLMAEPPEDDPYKAIPCERAVIMIDPFPEPPAYDVRGLMRTGLSSVIAGLVPTLINQARFKPHELANALDDGVSSRFLIAPRRRLEAGAEPEEFAIASGLLGGFGGFLDEEFRAHDYQLGRQNCYLFLRHHLTFPLENRVLREGYRLGARTKAYRAKSRDPNYPGEYYNLIPLVGSAAVMPRVPQWPRVPRAAVETLAERVKERAAALFGKLVKEQLPSRLLRGVAQAGWFLFGRSKVVRFVTETVLAQLYLRDQIKGQTKGVCLNDRKVIAALADPAFDFRTVTGIAEERGLSEATVTAALGRHAKLIYQGGKTARNQRTYTLEERKPGWADRAFIIGSLKRSLWSGDPVID